MKRSWAATPAAVDGPRRSPAEDKRLDYERQARCFSEYHHALRHGKWRRKRRAVQKAYRHEVAMQLALGGLDKSLRLMRLAAVTNNDRCVVPVAENAPPSRRTLLGCQKNAAGLETRMRVSS